MKTPRRGRPPKQGKPLMAALTIRMPQAMMDEIERRAVDQADNGKDKADIIRELIARGLGWAK